MATSASQSQSQPPSVEEEALKWNTDCVYFLASPLTCKKGSECEYRHSDIARVNPRDCYFWLHGNCLNPKCGFRHPPLDGLLGTQKTTTAPSAPVSQTLTAPVPHVPSASMQGAPPCVFFQKGYCLKGDWCPFLHVLNPSNTKPLLVPASAVEPANIKKPVTGVGKSVPQKVAPTNVAYSVKDTSGVKPPAEFKSASLRNEFAVSRRAPQTTGFTECFAHRSAPPVSNGTTLSWSNCVQQPHPFEEPESVTSKDVEEVSREHSPGFDVLVDGGGGESDFYAGEDRYGMPREHEMEYDNDPDYSMIAAVGDERYHDRSGFDLVDHRKGQYAWGASSDGSYRERRPHSMPDNLGEVNESDLRHRLAKHKKPNGLRSVITHDHARDILVRDQSYQGLHDNSLRSRLRGRIGLPQRSLSPNNMDKIRGSDRGRMSPVRASNQGRIRDRVQGRVEEAYNNGGRNYMGMHSRRDTVDENTTDFAGPKSLAELKKRKDSEPSKQHQTDLQPLGKRRHSILDGQQRSENEVSFEGPKPLEEILKRKRHETTGSKNKDIVEDTNREEGKAATNNGAEKVHESAKAEESKPAISNSSLQPLASKIEAEDGDYGVDQETEPYEQRDGDYDYEQTRGEDYELYDGENGDVEGEYVEEEDDEDDDFAKKMGVEYA